MKNLLIQYLLVIWVAILFFPGCREKNNSNDLHYGHGFSMGYGSGSYEDSSNMKNSLKLNDSQFKKINDVDSKYRKQYYQNRGDYNKINTLRNSHKNEIENVLNDNQKKIYRKIYKNKWHNWRRNHGMRHMGNYYGHGYGMGHGAGSFRSSDGMMQELNLNKEQIEKINKIDSKYRTKYYEKRNDYDTIESLRREHKKEIINVLTTSQKNKYDEQYNYRWRGQRNRHMGGGHMMGN
jgi:Spy/CpxP family protein refolding chaperone